MGDGCGGQRRTWKHTWRWGHTCADTQSHSTEATAHLGTGQGLWQQAQKRKNTRGSCTGKCKHAWDTRVQAHTQICKRTRQGVTACANTPAATGQNPSSLHPRLPRPCSPLLGGSWDPTSEFRKCKIGFEREAVPKFQVLAPQVSGADPSYSFYLFNSFLIIVLF